MRHLVCAVFNKITYVLPLTDVLPTAAGVATALRHTAADLIFVPPTILEEMYHNESMLDEVCRNVHYFVFAGGVLTKHIGEELSARTMIMSMYGASELEETSLMVPTYEWSRLAWKYLQFHNCFGAEFRPHSENLYEPVMKAKSSGYRLCSCFPLFLPISGGCFLPFPYFEIGMEGAKGSFCCKSRDAWIYSLFFFSGKQTRPKWLT